MSITKTLATVTTAMTLALSPILAAGPALAQDAPLQSMGPAADTYTDEQLSAFVVAAIDVAELSQSYQSRLQATEDAAEQQAISEEANQEILGTVEEAEGITVDEYMAISETAAADPDLNARIVELMQEEAPQPAQ